MKISDETRVKLDKLQQDYNDKCFQLIEEEAVVNNPYEKGDIIEDHYQVGKVLSCIIKINVNRRIYEISYKCERLTKKLKPYRGGELTTVYLCNVERALTSEP